MKTKIFILILLFFSLNLTLLAQEKEESTEKPEESRPNHVLMLYKNSLLPGLAQFELGQPKEGLAYMLTSVPLLLIGQGLFWSYFLVLNPDSFKREDHYVEGKRYLFNPEPNALQAENQWMLYTGLSLSFYSTLISGYSSYAAHRDYYDLYMKPEDVKRTGRDSLQSLLLAPAAGPL